MSNLKINYIAEIFNIKILDLGFINNLIETWDIDTDDLGALVREWIYYAPKEDLDYTNLIIRCIYDIILSDNDLMDEYYNIYINCLDSHLIINGVEVNSPEELEQVKKELKKKKK